MTDTQSLDWVNEQIRKQLSDPNIIYNLRNQVNNFVPVPCGIDIIDECLRGGLPKGRVIEISGPEASGKTTVTLHFIANAQKRGDVVYFVDAENALDLSWARAIGVDTDKLLLSQPDYGEQALEVCEAICDGIDAYHDKHPGKKMSALIVIDSVPALIPKQEYEVYEDKGIDNTVAMGARARMLSGKLPRIVNKASKSGVTVIFINQERDKIGVMYGPSYDTPGGRALKYFSSLRIRVHRLGAYKVGETIVGIRTKLIPIKSKQFSILNQSAEFVIGPNGIDTILCCIDQALAKNVVKKSGAWLDFNGTKFHGNADLEAKLKSDPAFLKQLTEAIKGAK